MNVAPPRAGSPARPSRLARWLAGGLFVAALPVFVIVGNVLGVARDLDFIERGFRTYDVGRTTGLDAAQLRAVAETFVEYLRNPAARLDIQVEIGGQRRPLFNRRELDHMVDVQHLFLLARRVRFLAGAYLLLFPLVGLAVERGRFLPRLGRLTALGGSATLGILLLTGALSLLDFTELWTRFHHVAFTNDLWILDPRTDYLIMLFPEGFWFDAVMRIAMLSAVEAAGLTLVGLALAYWGARR